MREPVLNAVNPVIRTALRLRDEWARGSGPGFDAGREQLAQAMRDVLRLYPPPPAGPSLATDRAAETDFLSGPVTDRDDRYLGIGYALASWADELFTLNSTVAPQWNERKFEAEFYATNDRAWRFWQQARIAADRTTECDLELFYLCAALGFRGEWVDDPAQLRAWLGATRDRLVKGLRTEWIGPPAGEPPRHATHRHGKARLRRMATIATIASLVCVPAAIALITHQLIR